MKRIIAIITIIVAITSCKKGAADFTLKGLITDKSFNTPLAGATAKLYEVEAGGGAVNLLGSMSLTDGNYSFTFKRNKAESYKLIVEKENYFDLNQSINFSDLTIEEDNVRNYGVYAKSWVNLRFINSNPQPADMLQYQRSQGKIDCADCCTAESQILEGAIDTNIYCINDGNTVYAYNYWILGTGLFGNKSVTTVPFDTTELLLTY